MPQFATGSARTIKQSAMCMVTVAAAWTGGVVDGSLIINQMLSANIEFVQFVDDDGNR